MVGLHLGVVEPTQGLVQAIGGQVKLDLVNSLVEGQKTPQQPRLLKHDHQEGREVLEEHQLDSLQAGRLSSGRGDYGQVVRDSGKNGGAALAPGTDIGFCFGQVTVHALAQLVW